ncbi:D-alanyl-D-alanine carboxypeptidase/D-alanyl-D-alanine endopeptidase [Myxosarcina sp. GI1(2024)]
MIRAKSLLRWFNLGLISLLLGLSIESVAANIENSSEIAQSLSDSSQFVCPQNLPTAINRALHGWQLRRSRWGIAIQTLNSRRTLYSRQADKFFIPASTAKLLTTAAALSELGADYRIYTPVYGLGEPPKLTYLRINGHGDPTISTKSLKKIVRVLQSKQIEHIENLIIEDSYFTPPVINPTWEWSDIYSYYGTSVTSLMLNQNSVTLTVLPQQLGQKVKLKWSDAIAARQWRVENNAITAPKNTPYNLAIVGVVGKPVLNIRGELATNEPPDIWDLAVADPQQYFLDTLRHLLTTEGIEVTKTTVASSKIQNISASKITTIISPPLAEIITAINRESNNLYAESLRKVLENNRQDKTREAIATSLTKLGINSHDYQLVDGSGLSRHNLITPQALNDVLIAMSRSPLFNIYHNSLAVAGTNGTLKNRFQNTLIHNNLWGKTGTLTGVAALSGYLYPTQYKPLIFSIIINNSDRSSQELRRAIDEIVLLLGKLKNCPN